MCIHFWISNISKPVHMTISVFIVNLNFYSRNANVLHIVHGFIYMNCCSGKTKRRCFKGVVRLSPLFLCGCKHIQDGCMFMSMKLGRTRAEWHFKHNIRCASPEVHSVYCSITDKSHSHELYTKRQIVTWSILKYIVRSSTGVPFSFFTAFIHVLPFTNLDVTWLLLLILNEHTQWYVCSIM